MVVDPMNPMPGTLFECTPSPGKPNEYCCEGQGSLLNMPPAPPRGTANVTCGIIKCFRCAGGATVTDMPHANRSAKRWRIPATGMAEHPSALRSKLPRAAERSTAEPLCNLS
jgi:hypothetical protein